jgi:UrcA family protein
MIMMRQTWTGRVSGRAGLLAALAAALGAHAVSTSAAEPEYASMTVGYGDLNLSSREGLDTLHRRISMAAQVVCGGDEQLRDPLHAVSYRGCVSAATNRALEKVHLAAAQVRWPVK